VCGEERHARNLHLGEWRHRLQGGKASLAVRFRDVEVADRQGLWRAQAGARRWQGGQHHHGPSLRVRDPQGGREGPDRRKGGASGALPLRRGLPPRVGGTNDQLQWQVCPLRLVDGPVDRGVDPDPQGGHRPPDRPPGLDEVLLLWAGIRRRLAALSS